MVQTATSVMEPISLLGWQFIDTSPKSRSASVQIGSEHEPIQERRPFFPLTLIDQIANLRPSGSASLDIFRAGVDAIKAATSSSRPVSTPFFVLADATAPEPVTAAWSSIDRLADYAVNMPEWDSISRQTVQAAKALIARFFMAVVSGGETWQLPHLSSDAEGGVTFEWWRHNHSLTLFAHPDGSAAYLLAWGPNIWTEMETGDNPDDVALLELWHRLNESE